MTTVNARRWTSKQLRALTTLGTAAAAVVGVGAVVVGAHLLDITPPAGDTSPYFPAAYPCLLPVANPLAANGSEPRTIQGPAIWKPGMPCGPVFTWDTMTPSDPMPAPVDASSRLNPD